MDSRTCVMLCSLYAITVMYIGVFCIGTALGDMVGWIAVTLYALFGVIVVSYGNGCIDSDPRTPMIY